MFAPIQLQLLESSILTVYLSKNKIVQHTKLVVYFPAAPYDRPMEEKFVSTLVRYRKGYLLS